MDRAALDVALQLGIPCGGWCPAGRWAEDGPLPPRYPLRETPASEPDQRTRWNVRDADATLIVARAPLSGGTELTMRYAAELGRPVRAFAPDADPREVRAWIERSGPATLNVAGPRESEAPGIYRAARHLLERVLRR